jgi:hypothetical protein
MENCVVCALPTKSASKKASSDTDYFKTFFHSDAYTGVAGDDDAYVRTLKGIGKDDISKFKQYIQMLGVSASLMKMPSL